MYRINEKVVYPGHGVALIQRIVEKKVNQSTVSFYELKLLSKDMTILTPTTNTQAAGIRPLSSEQEIERSLKKFLVPAKRSKHDYITHNWNKRNKDYQLKLRAGSLIGTLEIYYDLLVIGQTKELSFGERTLLHQTELLLVEEITAVNNIDTEQALEQLRLRSVYLQA